VVEAARSLAAIRRGALIVFERETTCTPCSRRARAVDAAVRASLLETLFHPETPLHDGAVIVRKDRVAAAGCILPLSEETLPSPTMGTRHRAGLGLLEESDALVLIVSEETGSLSLAKDGALPPISRPRSSSTRSRAASRAVTSPVARRSAWCTPCCATCGAT
jgi:diadenylate cyclase